jgi:hypothetical protein
LGLGAPQAGFSALRYVPSIRGFRTPFEQKEPNYLLWGPFRSRFASPRHLRFAMVCLLTEKVAAGSCGGDWGDYDHGSS